jgi:hypothetical protein
VRDATASRPESPCRRPLAGAALLAGVIAVAGIPAERPPTPVFERPVRFDVGGAAGSRFTLLPGIGPVLARRIVETREAAGGFESLDDLGLVPGIGPRTVESIRTRLAEPPPTESDR